MMLIPALLVTSCDETSFGGNHTEGGVDEGGSSVENLVPPETIKESNVFVVDFFSTLEDDGSFFTMRSTDSAVQHISSASGKRPLVYMFDRSDFEVGKNNPMTDIAYKTGTWQFFAQKENTKLSKTAGTGMVTHYSISDFDGIASNGAYMSGCMLPAPLSTPVQIVFYTARITSTEQLRTIHSLRSNKLLGDAVVIATVGNDIKVEAMAFVKDNMALRADCFGSTDTSLDVLVIVPASYVCRSIQQLKTANLPYYRVSIEKWM